jgi:2-polyprenyl-6-methoxyphenol hydroxylase-like FAD-dependent oxidoreductase
MRFAIAGGGVAGLAAALALARAGHTAVVAERDPVPPRDSPDGAFDEPRAGIPHFQQPHAFLPRGRRELREMAPDVAETLLAAGAEEQDVSAKLRGERAPGDEEVATVLSFGYPPRPRNPDRLGAEEWIERAGRLPFDEVVELR